MGSATGSATSPRQSAITHAFANVMRPASRDSPVAQNGPVMARPTASSRSASILVTRRARAISSVAASTVPVWVGNVSRSAAARRAAYRDFNPAAWASALAAVRIEASRASSFAARSAKFSNMTIACAPDPEASIRCSTVPHSNTLTPLRWNSWISIGMNPSSNRPLTTIRGATTPLLTPRRPLPVGAGRGRHQPG